MKLYKETIQRARRVKLEDESSRERGVEIGEELKRKRVEGGELKER